YFDRDVKCVRDFFKRRFGYESSLYPRFTDLERDDHMDEEVACSGYKRSKGIEDELMQEMGICLEVSEDEASGEKDDTEDQQTKYSEDELAVLRKQV
ncbi:jg22281, partial [Pararge aegeria aegeria]